MKEGAAEEKRGAANPRYGLAVRERTCQGVALIRIAILMVTRLRQVPTLRLGPPDRRLP